MDGDARWSRRQQGRCSKIAWDRERVLSERLRTDANEQQPSESGNRVAAKTSAAVKVRHSPLAMAICDNKAKNG